MKDTNLFGEPDDFTIQHKEAHGVFMKWKQDNQYHKATNTKKCGNCRYSVCCEYHNKNYYKCHLMGLSRSEASDIRVSYVCNKWKGQEE